MRYQSVAWQCLLYSLWLNGFINYRLALTASTCVLLPLLLYFFQQRLKQITKMQQPASSNSVCQYLLMINCACKAQRLGRHWWLTFQRNTKWKLKIPRHISLRQQINSADYRLGPTNMCWCNLTRRPWTKQQCFGQTLFVRHLAGMNKSWTGCWRERRIYFKHASKREVW